MVEVATFRVTELAAREWVKLYKLHPVLTMTFTLIVSVSLGLGVLHVNKLDQEKREIKRLENQDYQSQISQLDQMETNVHQLLKFVDAQKKNLQETEDTLSELKSEKEKLAPLVATDRAVVEALFKAQEERATSNIWRERWIGFGFGVVGSLIATFLWFVVSILIKGRHNKPFKQDK